MMMTRYMYIPLGGSRRKLLNVWVIFTFVAIWHDLEWKLLSWAWLTCLFFIPEMVAKSAANAFQVNAADCLITVDYALCCRGAFWFENMIILQLMFHVQDAKQNKH
ncbi:hypothetical protein Tsubulata_050739 [Turnera subulata]|uniref:Uncharacterized protein n=1 Tax=Turnera subulata TaxID=218843 RepID=A0A9Q0FJS7_9ROSI|nr:hypothetical protein Tsubulata_050739 [Turnera subulata]